MALVILGVGLAIGLTLVALVHITSKADYPAQRADVIVVLGARVMPDGELSTTLEHRIEAGYAAYKQNLAPAFIVCGARGGDEPMTEARAMADYLIRQGVPEDAVYLEDQSTDTFENLTNARGIMEEHGMGKALVVTSDYHIRRAMWLAEDADVNAAPYPAPGPDLWHNRAIARVKEALSWVKYYAQQRLFK